MKNVCRFYDTPLERNDKFMSAHFWYSSDRISPDSDDAFTEEEIEEIIGLVRESSFLDDESGASIDERMTEVFGGNAPEWSGFQTAEGFCCVNCGGVMTANGESMGVVIQFEIAEDLESFVLSGMLIDGIEQPEGLILQFEEQFATSLWDEYEGYDEDILPEHDRYDPRGRFSGSGYADWEESALWEDDGFDDDEEDDDEEEHHCGHHHDHGHHCGCGHEHPHFEEEIILRPLDDDDDDEDEEIGWGDDAAERFWYGSDEDE